MTAFYGATVMIAVVLAAMRLRHWMLRDAEPGHRRYFFAPIVRSATNVRNVPASKIHDLQALDGVDYASVELHGLHAFAKRALDIIVSAGLLIALAPLLMATAIAIKVTSPGPVLYRQKRVGQGGEIFEVFKFRSMRIDAEIDGPQWAIPNDDRVTGVGRIIRNFRIDEIPQAINVLNGEMSFVGPRPERPEFVCILEREIPHYNMRHTLKPGITGWAQVKHEYTASIDGAREKLKYDLFYVKKFTPILDLVIIVLTVRVVLFGLGSR